MPFMMSCQYEHVLRLFHLGYILLIKGLAFLGIGFSYRRLGWGSFSGLVVRPLYFRIYARYV